MRSDLDTCTETFLDNLLISHKPLLNNPQICGSRAVALLTCGPWDLGIRHGHLSPFALLNRAVYLRGARIWPGPDNQSPRPHQGRLAICIISSDSGSLFREDFQLTLPFRHLR